MLLKYLPVILIWCCIIALYISSMLLSTLILVPLVVTISRHKTFKAPVSSYVTRFLGCSVYLVLWLKVRLKNRELIRFGNISWWDTYCRGSPPVKRKTCRLQGAKPRKLMVMMHLLLQAWNRKDIENQQNMMMLTPICQQKEKVSIYVDNT